MDSLPTTQGLSLAKKSSVTRQGQRGEKAHPRRKPHERHCPQHPHSVPCSDRTGPQRFDFVRQGVACRVLTTPAAGTYVVPTFYFQIETIHSKKAHIARRSTQGKHTRQPPQESGQAEKQTPNFLIHTGLNLRKLECSLGNFKHQTSVLSGPISQTMYPKAGSGGGAGSGMLVGLS